MQLGKNDLGISYELFQNKVRSFIKGCDEDENKSPAFSTSHCPRHKVGWHLMMVVNSNYKVIVECIVKPWPQGGPLVHCFDSGIFFLNLCIGSLKQKARKRGRMFDNGNVKYFFVSNQVFCVEPCILLSNLVFYVENECCNACRHPASTWTNFHLSSVRSSDIHLRAVSQEIPQPLIVKTSLEITYLKLHSNLPGANELKDAPGIVQEWPAYI